MSGSIALEITTPEGVIREIAVGSVVLPTEMGEVGILPGHMPLAGIIVAGLLRFTHNGGGESVAVDEGYFLLQANHLSVMVDAAITVAEIDPMEADLARLRAEEAMAKAKHSQLDAEEISLLEAKIRYQIVKQRAKR
jgi:F-type H+-transporting ATPase subunit epsilon